MLEYLPRGFGASGEASGATDGRYNVLLPGGDAGAGRWGLRPDSITVASIDAETGRTVLIGLPRNLEDFPFREGSVMAEQFPPGASLDAIGGGTRSQWLTVHRHALGAGVGWTDPDPRLIRAQGAASAMWAHLFDSMLLDHLGQPDGL